MDRPAPRPSRLPHAAGFAAGKRQIPRKPLLTTLVRCRKLPPTPACFQMKGDFLMLYTGPAFSAAALGDGIVELKFDLAGDTVNKLNQVALQDFDKATQAIAKDSSVKGVIVTSAKPVFIVGADVTEFTGMFAAGEESVAKGVLEVNRMLCRFEDLPFPTVAAINGICLGGGLELALACDYRVMSTAASAGFPEVKLGIFPGFGGSVACRA